MGCIKLGILEREYTPIEVVYRANELKQKTLKIQKVLNNYVTNGKKIEIFGNNDHMSISELYTFIIESRDIDSVITFFANKKKREKKRI